MSLSYCADYSVRSQDLDCFGLCRASALLCYLQDAAAEAAAQFEAAGPQMIAKYRQIWMLARLRCTLDAPIHWRDTLTVRTWFRPTAGTIMYRDYDILVNGQKTGEALAAWVLADMDSRTLSRMDAFPEFVGNDGGSLSRDTRIPHLRLPRELPLLEERRLHYSDADLNGHVNNTHYADYMCDALHMENAPAGTYVREFQINYVDECRPGELLCLSGAVEGDRRYVSGSDPEGRVRFQGYFIW